MGNCLVRGNRKLKMQLSDESRRRHFLEHILQNFEIVRLHNNFLVQGLGFKSLIQYSDVPNQ